MEEMETRLRQMVDILSRSKLVDGSDSTAQGLLLFMRRFLAPIHVELTDLSKPALNALRALSKDDRAGECLLMFNDITDRLPVEDNQPLVVQQPIINIDFDTDGLSRDPGVEVEYSMTPEALATNLGYVNGLPRIFNRYRHRAGVTPWDFKSAALFQDEAAKENPDMSPFVLHWHQLAGVHAIIRNIFSAQPGPGNFQGMLIADDVGLGKTCQSICVIGFLVEAIWRRKKVKKPAPIQSLSPIVLSWLLLILIHVLLIVERPYLGDHEVLPERPFLVIVPGTVQFQWVDELRQILDPGFFDILAYGTGLQSHQEFWADNGPFHQSTRPIFCRVIVTSHSVRHIRFFCFEKC